MKEEQIAALRSRVDGMVIRISPDGQTERGWESTLARQLQHLFKHGHCVAVTITRPMLYALNWIPGQAVITELLEDGESVIVRLPRQEDFGPMLPPRLLRKPAKPQQLTFDLAEPRKPE